MSGFLQRADETPFTYIIALAYVTMAFLTDPVNPTVGDLIHYGAAVGFLIQDGEHWRLLTHAFLHGGIIHLAFNTFFLIQIGPMLERRLGSVKFGALYLISAVAGGMAGSLWHHELVPLVGGSGALFGMLGAAVAVNMRSGRHLLDFLHYHGPRQLLGLIAINLILGFMIPFVSNAAHIGGLVSGFALAFCFLDRGRSPVDGAGRAVQTAWVAVFVSVLFYCAYPVVRWDYLMTRAARADEPDRARDFALAFFVAEPKPFTSTFSLSQLSRPEILDELVRQVKEHYQTERLKLKGG